MLDAVLLPRFLLVAHSVVAIGLAAWYSGVIPRGQPERRFRPLGAYMLTTLLDRVVLWLGLQQPALAATRPWADPLFAVVAVSLLGLAFRWHRQDDPESRRWPLAPRLGIVAHALIAFVLVPWTGLIFSETAGSLVLIWIIVSQMRALRRRGHFLHGSMAAAVLASLALGGLGIKKVHDHALRTRTDDLRDRVAIVADFIAERPQLIESAVGPDTPAELHAALASLCNNSAIITGAFILPGDDPSARFAARYFANNRSPLPRFASAAHYAALLKGRNAAVAERFHDPADDRDWMVAIVPLHRANDTTSFAFVGALAPVELLEADIADLMFATEVIVVFVAVVIYLFIAGYLQSVVRVWQRNTLLEVTASHSQQLLNSVAPDAVSRWLVGELRERLGLIHASYWVYRRRNHAAGFQVVASDPPVGETETATPHWHSLNELPSPWAFAIKHRQPLEGSLADLGCPLPQLDRVHAAVPWVFADHVECHGELHGSIVIVFAERHLAARPEVRSALRSLANSLSFCLARDQRAQHLAAAEERLRTIIDTSPDGFWDADYTRETCYRSDRWWRMLGHEPPTEPGELNAFETLIEPDDLIRLRADVSAPLPPGRTFRRREYRVRHSDGSWRWIESNTVEIRNVHGPAERALGFDRDVTERHVAEERLRDAADEAARANRAKSEFLATMNHELRTPLNDVVGFAAVLDRSPLNASQRQSVAAIRSSAEQLLGLVTDVLDLSRIEAGRLELETAPFELRRATEQALEPFARLATDKEVALLHEFESDHQPAWVLGDLLRLRQILTNLVGHAVKSTSSGFVRLRARQTTQDRWEFRVEDSGAGIPPGQLAALFSRFNQVDPTGAPLGGGLGLAISRELARAMDGDVTVESTVGEGTTFKLTLRLAAARGEQRRYTDESVAINQRIPVFQADEHDLAALRSTLRDTGCSFVPCANTDDVFKLLRETPTPFNVLFPRAFRPAAQSAAKRIAGFLVERHLVVTLVALQPPSPEPGLTSPFQVELAAPVRRRDLIDVLDRHHSHYAHAGRPPAPKPTPPVAPPTPPPARVASPPSVTTTPAANSPVGREPAPGSTVRVLVAEDHPVNREVAHTMLQHLGIRADFAEDGRAAIELLERHSYDLALIDIQMPVLDGYGVAKWARSSWHQRWQLPKLVAVTANANQGDRERCLDAGMDDYVAKPLTFATLSDLIANLAPDDAPVNPPASPANSQPVASDRTAPADSHESETADEAPEHAGDGFVDWPAFASILTFTAAEESPEILQRIIRTYVTDRDEVLNAVRALDPADHSEARKLLHKLKGSTGSLALMGVVDTIKQLHDPVEGPPREIRDRLLNQIQRESDLALQAVFLRYPWLEGEG